MVGDLLHQEFCEATTIFVWPRSVKDPDAEKKRGQHVYYKSVNAWRTLQEQDLRVWKETWMMINI